MKDDANDDLGTGDGDLRLAAALIEYQNLCAAGHAPTLQDFLENHSGPRELRDDLRALESLDGMLAPAREPPEHFGEFEVVAEIGRGGMGIVYEAKQRSLDRTVALKVLPPALVRDSKARARFRREVRVAAKFQHPNIVGVHSAGVENGTPYLAMELAKGSPLSRLMRRFRFSCGLSTSTSVPVFPSAAPVEDDLLAKMEEIGVVAEETFPYPTPPDDFFDASYWSEVATAFAGAADGLQYAHSLGVIHRDIKPSNLVLEQDGRLRLLDFGVARVEGEESLTETNERVGTILYMSPEQALRKKVGPASDIYSLGATLYEVIVWRPPSPGDTTEDIFRRIVHRDPAPPRSLNAQVPKSLDTIIMKCLRKSSNSRYGTAEALAQDLRRFVRGDPIEAEPETWTNKIIRRAGQYRSLILQSAAILSLLVTTTILGVNYLDRQQADELAQYRDTVRQGVMSLLKAPLLAPERFAEDIGWGIRISNIA